MTREQELLLDCWFQWSLEINDGSRKGNRTHGGLSTLEDVRDYLVDNGLIDPRTGRLTEKP